MKIETMIWHVSSVNNMAASLMSLVTTGTIKHVVPWKSRHEFLEVYEQLYSTDEEDQGKAVQRITTWKSRTGPKLSVAIESSAALRQACLDHDKVKQEEQLPSKESQLKSSYSLALIRFVNHVTEKGQTKATAQPVHLVAREFGIPEWIVRIRHDATHGSLPCLDALATGAKWALDYLQENFWGQQLVGDSLPDESDIRIPCRKSPKIAKIRRGFFDFQEVRYQELHSDKEVKVDHIESVKKLIEFLHQDRSKFLKCLLEDGTLIATEEQLLPFGISEKTLLSQSPPQIPSKMSEFWRPVLRRIGSSSSLPQLLNTMIFSVTSGEGRRNHLLVAWILFVLAQTTEPLGSSKRKTRKKKQELYFKNAHSLPRKTLLAAVLQNINMLTVHLLKYVAEKVNIGEECYHKVMKLLKIHSKADINEDYRSSQSSASDESDPDRVFTWEDIKNARDQKFGTETLSASTVQDICSSVHEEETSLRICTDLVDWSSVPLGMLPPQPLDNDEDDDDDNNDNGSDEGGMAENCKDDGNSKDEMSDSCMDKFDTSNASGKRKRPHQHGDDDEDSNAIKQPRILVTEDILL